MLRHLFDGCVYITWEYNVPPLSQSILHKYTKPKNLTLTVYCILDWDSPESIFMYPSSTIVQYSIKETQCHRKHIYFALISATYILHINTMHHFLNNSKIRINSHVIFAIFYYKKVNNKSVTSIVQCILQFVKYKKNHSTSYTRQNKSNFRWNWE